MVTVNARSAEISSCLRFLYYKLFVLTSENASNEEEKKSEDGEDDLAVGGDYNPRDHQAAFDLLHAQPGNGRRTL